MDRSNACHLKVLPLKGLLWSYISLILSVHGLTKLRGSKKYFEILVEGRHYDGGSLRLVWKTSRTPKCIVTWGNLGLFLFFGGGIIVFNLPWYGNKFAMLEIEKVHKRIHRKVIHPSSLSPRDHVLSRGSHSQQFLVHLLREFSVHTL